MRFYLAKFGLALPEMRLLSTLGSRRRLSSLELVKLTAMDKGLVSRVLMVSRSAVMWSKCRPLRPPIVVSGN